MPHSWLRQWLDAQFVAMRIFLEGYTCLLTVFVAESSLHFFQYYQLCTQIIQCYRRRVVSVLDSCAEGPGLKSPSRRCRVTVLGKLFTPIVPLFTKQWNW